MTTSLPQSNATLLSISKPSKTENYTHAEGAPTIKWQGEADAYVSRKIISALGERGELNRVQAVDIIVPGDLVPAVDVEGGDSIAFQQWDPTRGEMRQYVGKAQTFSTPADLPSLPNEVKIALERVSARP